MPTTVYNLKKYGFFTQRNSVGGPLLSVHTWGPAAPLKSVTFCQSQSCKVLTHVIVVNDVDRTLSWPLRGSRGTTNTYMFPNI